MATGRPGPRAERPLGEGRPRSWPRAEAQAGSQVGSQGGSQVGLQVGSQADSHRSPQARSRVGSLACSLTGSWQQS
jgi:hypothetical protein